MNFAEFKSFLSNHLWREGDMDFEKKVELFVRLGEGRLNRDLLIEDRSSVAIAGATSERLPLPADCAVVRQVSAPDNSKPDMEYITPSAILQLRAQTKSNKLSSQYSVQGRNLLLAGPMTGASPINIQITYYENIPSLVDTDGSYVLDQYFDLYLYAVLSHTATYLREDPRLAIWKAEYKEALDSVIEFNEKAKYTQGPLHMPLPGNVA